MKFEFDFAMIHLKKKVFCFASTLLFCQVIGAQEMCLSQLSKGQLRNFTSEHIAAATTILNDPKVSEYLHTYLAHEIPYELAKMIWNEDDSLLKGYWYRDELVALVGLKRDKNQLRLIAKTESEKQYLMLWFAVKPSQQGQGFGTGATRALLKFLFEQTDLPGVFACFNKRNISSRNLVARVGFSLNTRVGASGSICAHLSRERFLSNL